MNEPFKKIYTVDETAGINYSSPSNSLNIATFIVSPTGPVERTTVTSQSDLLNNFVGGNAFSPNNDKTIQHIGTLVQDSPIDVIRVDSSSLREGLTSTGLKYYTDKDFNPIDYYTKVDFNDSIKKLVPRIYVIVTLESQKYCFYAGSTLPEGVQASQGYSVTDDELDYEGFLNKLNKVAIDSLDGVGTLILSKSATGIIFSSLVSEVSGLLNYQESIILNATGVQSLNDSTELARYIAQGDYIKLNGNTLYYAGDGTLSTLTMTSPIPIESNKSDLSKVSVSEFLISVDNEIRLNNKLQNSLGLTGNYSVQLNLAEPTSVEPSLRVELSSNLLDRISNKFMMNEDSEYTGIELIAVPSELLSGGWMTITLTTGDVTYWFGDNDVPDTIVPSSIKRSGYHVVSTPATPQKFLVNVLNHLEALGSSLITPTFSSDVLSIIYQTDNAPSIGVRSSSNFIEIVNHDMRYKRASYMPMDSLSSYQKYDNLFINIDDYTFYSGDYATVVGPKPNRIKVSSESLSISEFIDEVVTKGNAYMTLSRVNNGLIIQSYSDEGCEISATEGLLAATPVTLNQLTVSDKFAVISRFPSNNDLFKFEYSKNADDSFNFNFIYNGISDNRTLSFNPDALDGYGQSIYYNKVNEGNSASRYVYLLELSGSDVLEEYSSNNFGAGLKSPKVTSEHIVNTINKYREYTDKYYNYIWDAGYTDPVVSKALMSLAEDINSQYVMSYPAEYKKASQFIDYRESVGSDSFRGYSIIPSYKNSTLGTFLTTLSCSTAFLQLKLKNFNSISAEFAACFGPRKGLVSTPNLTVKLGKTDREKLLDYQINTVMTTSTGYQINFNTSMQKTNSYLSEEQNVQMTDTIVHVCDEYSDELIAMENDVSLWNMVVNQLTLRLTQRLIANKSPAPAGLKVVMNAELNPNDVIESRQAVYQVWVQYTPTVAWVLGYTKVMKLGSF